MTEEEWLACESPQKMREHLEEAQGDRASGRKLRLFACACCRRVDQWFLDQCQLEAVRILERYADGLATGVELAAACAAADAFDEVDHLLSEERGDIRQDWLNAADHAARAVAQATANDPPGAGEPTYFHRLHDTILHTVGAVGFGAVAADAQNDQVFAAQDEECRALVSLLRCVIGNPFRPVAVDSAWLTSTVVALASQMYASRDFSPMPILADALQDAGCENADVLTHCRGQGPHVRGCWVVDRLLGK